MEYQPGDMVLHLSGGLEILTIVRSDFEHAAGTSIAVSKKWAGELRVCNCFLGKIGHYGVITAPDELIALLVAERLGD